MTCLSFHSTPHLFSTQRVCHFNYGFWAATSFVCPEHLCSVIQLNNQPTRRHVSWIHWGLLLHNSQLEACVRFSFPTNLTPRILNERTSIECQADPIGLLLTLSCLIATAQRIGYENTDNLDSILTALLAFQPTERKSQQNPVDVKWKLLFISIALQRVRLMMIRKSLWQLTTFSFCFSFRLVKFLFQQMCRKEMKWKMFK